MSNYRRSKPTTERGEEFLRQSMILSRLGLRVFPVGHDRTPLIRKYAGAYPFGTGALASLPWDKADAVGLVLGAEHLALDVDVKGDYQGDVHLEALQRLYGPLPECPQRTTPSGGVHLVMGLGQIPKDFAFASHAVLPDGSFAHIDLIHAKHRYLVVHDFEAWAEQPLALGDLPESWLPAVQRSSTRRVSSGSFGVVPSPGKRELDDLVAEVARTKVHRNEVLNRTVFLATLQGHGDAGSLDRFRAASQLGDVETEKTIQSGRSAAARKVTRAVRWYRAVAKHPILGTPRRRVVTLAVAMAFIDLYLTFPEGRPLGMSVRQLSEAANISIKAASVSLREFRKFEFLTFSGRAERAKAAQYQLAWPSEASAFGNSLPPSLEGRVLPNGDGEESFSPAERLRQRIATHPACTRLGRGPVLSPTCVDVLVALTEAPGSRASLAKTTGRSWSAVDRAVLVLVSAGIADFDTDSGLVWLLDEDILQALDDWADWAGVSNRPELRRMNHEKERECSMAHIGQIEAALRKHGFVKGDSHV